MSLFVSLARDLRVIYAAAFLRSLGVGLTGVILGVYLARAGYSPAGIGLVIAAGLAGGALATAGVSFFADRLGRRQALLAMLVLNILGGAGFALTTSRGALLAFAFLGLVNGMGRDRGPIFALEQAIIPQTVRDERRTLALSWHGLSLDAGHALGALSGALPLVLARALQIEVMTAYKFAFGLYVAVNVLSLSAYLFLSPRIEASQESLKERAPRVSPEGRSAVLKLAALSGLDSLGGGFLTDALIAYWFFERFGLNESRLGLLFFGAHLLNSISYLIAAWLSKRIGLLNTMVFTHIPASLLLMSAAFAPSAVWAVVLFLGHEALVEMDVPTRQSYILAVVQPGERTFASGVTNLTRNVSRSVTPSLAGYAMQHVALATPLYFGGCTKIVYDVLLYIAFRRLKPPEERTKVQGR